MIDNTASSTLKLDLFGWFRPVLLTSTSCCQALALARWWRHQHPIIVRLIQDYGTLLIDFLAPFTPRAARRAGYRCASRDIFRSLYRLESELPGGERGWSSRWRRGLLGLEGEGAPSWVPISVDGAINGVGVAAAAVVLAAGVMGNVGVVCT